MTLSLNDLRTARTFKARIESPLILASTNPADVAAYTAALSLSAETISAACYHADHYATNRRDFLNACGLRAEARLPR